MNPQIDRMYEHYHSVLYACLQSGKWSMTQAKNEALCAVKNFYKDNDDIQAAIMDSVKMSVDTRINESLKQTTGEE